MTIFEKRQKFEENHLDQIYYLERKIADGFLRHHRRWNRFTNLFFNYCTKKYPESFKEKKDLAILVLRFGNSPDYISGSGPGDIREACCNLTDNWVEAIGLKFYFSVLFVEGTYSASFGYAKFWGEFTIDPQVNFEYLDVSYATFNNHARYGSKDLVSRHQNQQIVLIKQANFSGVKFLDDAIFNRVTFENRKALSRRGDSDKISFKESSFKGFLLLISVNFKNNTTFKSASFQNTTFLNSEFEQNSDFSEACFGGRFIFNGSFNNVIFKDSKFKELNFYINQKNQSANFENVIFEEASKFVYMADSAFELDLTKALFKGPSAHFTKSEDNKNYLGLNKIIARHTIFECPAIFDFKLKECPDFSKTHFLKYYSIAETWLKEGDKIPDSQITKDDVEKFRFFKNYFEKNGNHFKEREYFAYEMNAVEKRKKFELKNPKKAEEKPSKDCWLKRFFSGRRWKKRLCLSRLKFRWRRFFDLDSWLFSTYKKNSNFGIEIRAPFINLVVSFIIFFLVFSIIFQEEFTQKPQTTSTQIINKTEVVYSGEAKHLVSLASLQVARDPSDAPQDDRNQNTKADETSPNKKEIATFNWNIAAKTLLLTFNPFASSKILENGSFWFVFVGVIQAFINTILLFLLGLGIRNRFKLK